MILQTILVILVIWAFLDMGYQSKLLHMARILYAPKNGRLPDI